MKGNKIEVLSFDELVRFHNLSLTKWDEDNYASENTQLANDFFEAGRQSKQAEIDHLQKRIDEIINHMEINYDENRDDDSHSYWSGYNQALRELSEILKGGETK